MPQPISKDAERRLVGALADVVDSVGEGDTPTAAIVKAAREAGLPAGHVAIMASAYNVGRTARQREDGADTAEKAADFALADGAEALAILFPERPAKAASLRPPPVDEAYSRPPTARRKAASAAAYMPLPEVVVADRSGTAVGVETARLAALRDDTLTYAKEARDRSLLARAADDAGTDAARLERELAGRLAKLAAYFAGGMGLQPDDMRPNVEALHGDVGLVVLDHVAPRGRMHKRASTPHRADREPAYADVVALIGLAGDLDEARAARDTLRKAAAPSRAEAAATPVGLAARLGKQALGGLVDKGIAGGIYQMAGNVVDGFKGKTPDQMLEKQLSRVATPEHEDGLRAIQTQALMHEMLADDEVLRGHDPRDVAQAYNRIARYAPHIAGQPLTAIPLVRKALAQGQLDSFDAKEVADTEDKYRRSRAPSAPPAPAPAKPAGGK